MISPDKLAGSSDYETSLPNWFVVWRSVFVIALSFGFPFPVLHCVFTWRHHGPHLISTGHPLELLSNPLFALSLPPSLPLSSHQTTPNPISHLYLILSNDLPTNISLPLWLTQPNPQTTPLNHLPHPLKPIPTNLSLSPINRSNDSFPPLQPLLVLTTKSDLDLNHLKTTSFNLLH